MTKEELQKEAYEWTEKNISVGISMYNPSIEMYCGKAYKDGAEPREKQIQIDAEQIRALQKQNGELTDKVNDLEEKLVNADYQLEGRDNEIRELEAQLETEKQLNKEIKARFVKCNTCTDEMKEKCLMFSEDLCQGERCEELVDLMGLINKSELQNENAELKEELTEAKEILREFVDWATWQGNSKCPSFRSVQDKAEQFLNEVEK